MKSTEKYVLSGIRQLIDLNKDITNFDLTFSVVSLDGSDFEAVVVDQNILDTNSNIEYKNAPGSISGNIIADRGVFQSYFLLLKCESNKNVECEVTVEIKEIPVNPNYASPKPGTPPPAIKEQFPPSSSSSSKAKSKSFLSDIKSKIDFKLILKVLLVVAAIGFIYFKFFKTSSSGAVSNDLIVKDNDDLGSNVATPVARSTSPLLNIEKNNYVDDSLRSISTPAFKTTLPNIIIPKISSPRVVVAPTLMDNIPESSVMENVLPKIDTVTSVPNIAPSVPKIAKVPSVPKITTSTAAVSLPTPPVVSNAATTSLDIPKVSSSMPDVSSSNINSNLFQRLKSLELKT